MSLDFSLYADRPTCVFDTNMTHNVTSMADKAGVYGCLWRPAENGYTRAGHLVQPIMEGLARLKTNPEAYIQLEAPNGWGTYEQFVGWLEEVLDACNRNPDAVIDVSR